MSNLKTIMAKLTSTLRKAVPLSFNNPANYYEAGGGWGHAVYFTKDNAPEGMTSTIREVHGFQPRRPSVGDVLLTGMSSGRTGVYIFASVKLVSDPNDMFFGVVKWRGYEDELTMPAKATYANGPYLL